jgi:hypothetical protein
MSVYSDIAADLLTCTSLAAEGKSEEMIALLKTFGLNPNNRALMHQFFSPLEFNGFIDWTDIKETHIPKATIVGAVAVQQYYEENMNEALHTYSDQEVLPSRSIVGNDINIAARFPASDAYSEWSKLNPFDTGTIFFISTLLANNGEETMRIIKDMQDNTSRLMEEFLI